MIVDRVRIFISAGSGGNGAVSFRREKFVPAGGPDGGDGGNGGDLIFKATSHLRTLSNFRPNQKFIAGNGKSGEGSNKKGADGEDKIIEVPIGTVIIDEDTGKTVIDLNKECEVKVLSGGRGGKGNTRFATPTRRTPNFSTPGRKVVGRFVILELKSIADVGIIGLPNAGKSTFLSAVTNATPKIANYPFTTLSPNLGSVTYKGFSFILADIPGLIEGASEGVGLGHDFLRHIERTRMLLHMIDVSDTSALDPIETYRLIRTELEKYSSDLASKPEIVVANKVDDLEDDLLVCELEDILAKDGIKVIRISAAGRTGTTEVLDEIIKILPSLPEPELVDDDEMIESWRNDSGAGRDYEISVGEDGIVEVNGATIDDIFQRIIPTDPDSMRHFQKLLIDYGIIDALKDFGVANGDEIRLNGLEFDYVD